MKLVRAAIVGEEKKVVIETGFSPDIIAKLDQVNKEDLGDQVKQLTKAFYQMSNRFKDQVEQLNALTCAIQELQHDQENSTQPFDKDPKLQELFAVNQAWVESTKKKNRKMKFD